MASYIPLGYAHWLKSKNTLLLHNTYVYKQIPPDSISRIMFFLLTLSDQLLAEMRRPRKCQICTVLTAKYAYSCCFAKNNKRMKVCYHCFQGNAIQDITYAVLDLDDNPVKQVSCFSCKTRDIRIINSQGQTLSVYSLLQIDQIIKSAEFAGLYLEDVTSRVNVDIIANQQDLIYRVLKPLMEILHVTEDRLLSFLRHPWCTTEIKYFTSDIYVSVFYY